MKLSEQTRSVLQSALMKAINKYKGNEEETIVTDLHLQPNQVSGHFVIYNDDDEQLADVMVDEWATDEENESDDFYETVAAELRPILNKIKENGTLDHLTIMKPFSFVLVDEDKETVTELLLMDDDTLMLDDGLLKGLDQELDEFLKELLEKE